MALIHVSFACEACGLTIEADTGAPAEGRGGRYLRAFWCPREARALTLDVNAPGFRGACPHCGTLLDLLADFPLDACPRCHAPARVEKTPRRGTSISREGGTGKP